MRTRNPLVEDDKYLPDPKDRSARQGRAIQRVVCHTTGSGIVGKAMNVIWDGRIEDSRILDPEECAKITAYAAKYYKAVNGVSTHYLIGWWGDVWQLLDEEWRAWSAGMSSVHLAAYHRGLRYWETMESSLDGKRRKLTPIPRGMYEWWKKEYQEITGAAPQDDASPLEFFPGDTNPDLAGISIDFLAPPMMTSNDEGRRTLGPSKDRWPLWSGRDQYTHYQYSMFNLLCRDLCAEYPDMKLDRRHILPHSVTDPLARVQFQKTSAGLKVGYGYDPGETWNLRWDWILSPYLVTGEYL